jgi:1,4-alpha-glucan branching enzyme
LFAPNNKEATLIDSFYDWKSIPMATGENGYFCTQIELYDVKIRENALVIELPEYKAQVFVSNSL